MRHGRGFAYHEPQHDLLIADAELLDRIRALAVPPAWQDVWISPHPNGHIQATGVDAAGRRQYLYHPAWRDRMDRLKFDRMLVLAESLPGARRAVTLDLRRDEHSRERTLAAAFRMLDTASLRVGSERYANEHGSIGLCTLRGSHVTVHEDDTVELRFPAKSGQAWESDLRDPDLATLLRTLKRRGPTARLLAWRDDRHEWHPLHPEEINGYVRERTGDAFSAKDFRTLHGTAVAALSLARTGPQRTPTARRRAIAAAMRDASAALGNTPAIARGSYVDPRVVDCYEDGRTIDPHRPRSVESQLRALLLD